MRIVGSFVVTVAGLFVACLLFVHIVDPRGEFGTGIFPTLVWDTRARKIELFTSYNADRPVQGIVVGSSRSMKLVPSDLQMWSGLRFFNFAVEGAMAEDYLAIYRWVRQAGAWPQILIIGLDVEALHDNDVPHYQFTRNTALVGVLTGERPQKTAFEKVHAYKRALTIQYLEEALRSSLGFLWRGGRESTTLEPDGYLRYVEWERQRAAGTFNLDYLIRTRTPGYVRIYEGMTGLSAKRKAYVEQLITEAREDGASVIVWLAGLHPIAVEYLGRRTRYLDLLRQARAYIMHLGKAYNIRAYDYSEPGLYNGTLTGWYDPSHTDETNSALIAAGLAKGMR